MRKMRELRPELTSVCMNICKAPNARTKEQSSNTEYIVANTLEPFDFSQQNPLPVARFLAMAAAMIRPSTAFGRESSRWHDYEDTKKRLESHSEKFDVHGHEPPDSWHHFNCFVSQG